MKTVSICIPVYNEAKNVVIAVQAVENIFKSQLTNYKLEIIITDNCSDDETWDVVNQLASEKNYLKGYRFARNFGYQNSVLAGLTLATGDAVIELDADLEDPPDVIPQFIEKWEQGFQVVYGIRMKRHNPIYKKVLFKIFYIILDMLSDFRIPRDTGDFRLLDRKVVNVLVNLPERNLYLRGLVSYLGFKQIGLNYKRNPRTIGESKFKFFNYVVFGIDAITAFSKAPLRLIGICGFLMFFISVSLGMYYLIGSLRNGSQVPGFATLVILTLFLNSLTFVFLGIIGEYLSRIFDDAKFRPRVIVSEATGNNSFPPVI